MACSLASNWSWSSIELVSLRRRACLTARTANGAFAAIYRYAGAMFNAFHPLSDDDEVWFPREGKVPAIGTKVEVSIKPMPDVKPSAGWKEPVPEKKESKSKTKATETKN